MIRIALAFDAAEAAALAPAFAGLSAAPYLARLAAKDPARAERLAAEGPAGLVAEALAAARGAGALAPPEAMSALRRAKETTHFAVAFADLAGLWPLEQVTGALSAFADAALRAALDLAAAEAAARGDIAPPQPGDPAGPVPGLIVLAMGKHGACELNYSSDVDFTVFFDRARMPVGPNREAQPVALRLVRTICHALETSTADGYVFRTDLRLRPDPGSTAPAVSLAAAEHYYQTLGQNWERAAFIKARACAGDVPAGEAFLATLASFIWRKHLDYAAIADIRSIKRQIAAHKAGGADLDDPVCDVKVGRGGIRDIELFAQTQQLILGGRRPGLRARTTLGALDALVEACALAPEDREALGAAYVFLRGVEHRVQMLADEQTHRVPADPALRLRVARLCGFVSEAEFAEALAGVRKRVVAIDQTLFPLQESLADPLGSLSFTGVEDDPDTLETLSKLGFVEPASVSGAIRGWHHGRIRAMRSERARELLTALTPKLLRALAGTGEPDVTFQRFAAFFEALPAGVQMLSLFQAQPHLMDDLAAIFALAAAPSRTLARQASAIEAMLEERFGAPLEQDPPGARADAFLSAVRGATSFEARLNVMRRLAREESFRIDAQLLLGKASAAEAGVAHSDLAEACVQAAAFAAEAEVCKGQPAPGAAVVLGLGKFGGRELAEGSDLDLMVVYEPSGDGAPEAFARLTQRLITALSAPTEEGGLYQVDMQLRPSGSKGPVAVRASSFERYYREEAWTWELMALTRARAVAGPAALGRQVEAIARAALSAPREPGKLIADVADMRARLDRDRPGQGLWDLKLAPGGLVDLEFIAQGLCLAGAARGADVIRANTGEALAALAGAGLLGAEDHTLLGDAFRLYSALQHLLRISVAGPFRPEAASMALKARLAAVAGVADFAGLEPLLSDRKASVRAVFRRLIGDGTAPLLR